MGRIDAVSRGPDRWVAGGWLALVGCSSPAEVADPARIAWFEEVAEQVGIDFIHQSGHDGQRYLLPESAAGGVALFDMDSDGDLDIYLIQGAGGGNRLFENRGADGPEGLRFVDVTAQARAGDTGYGVGVTSGDYDGDGDPDLYITNVGANVLLRNDRRDEGDVVFSDVSVEAGVADSSFGTGAAFFDFDRDGDLDLYLVNYVVWSEGVERDCRNRLSERDYCDPNEYGAPAPDRLFRNEGPDGSGVVRFRDVSREAGIQTAWGNGLGVVVADFNNDTLPDVFVANDRNPDHLWLNRSAPDGARFVEQAVLLGCAVDEDGVAKAGMGVDAVDVDDDGDLDLLVGNFKDESDSLFRNEGDYLVDVTAGFGLKTASRPFTRFGLALVDFDNDGWLDLFEATGRVARQERRYTADPYAEPNLVFRGVPRASGGQRFELLANPGGDIELPIASARAAAFGDIDNDGGMDVVIVNRDGPAHLLHNLRTANGNWISFRPVTAAGADAFESTVSIEVHGRRMSRPIRTAHSYLAASDPRAHFGLGSADAVSTVEVRWPDGEVEEFGSLEVGRVWELRQGAGTAQASATIGN